MGEIVRLASAPLGGDGDGFEYEAWREPPREARRGGLVVLHAIWGVTPHLRELAADYAEIGYEVLIPSLFDRFQRGFPDVNVDPALMAHQMGYGEATKWGLEVLDAVQAAIDALDGPVFVMGFCFGGTAAWLAAQHCHGIAAVASFYGGQITLYLDGAPQAPTILHMGKADELIPPADIEAIRAAHPDLPVYMYEAGHAFVAPNGFHEESAGLSKLRTLAHFSRHSGLKGES